MRVLLLRSSRGFFGAERAILDLASRLGDRDVEVCVGCLDDAREPHLELVKRAGNAGLETWTVPVRGRVPLRAAVTTARAVRDGAFDLLHVHDYKTLAIGVLAARAGGCALVASLHGETGHTRAVRLYERAAREGWRAAQRLIAVSRPLYELANDKLPDGRVVYIPNGVDAAGLRTRAQALAPESGPPTIVSVGRLSPEKGHSVLVAAVARLGATRPRLVIVGEGPTRRALTEQAQRLGVALSLPGFLTDVVPTVSGATIFCLPSTTEGLPIALLEAMAIGAPVIASDVGDVGAVLADGAGRVVPPGDVTALASALGELLADSEVRRRLVERAAVRVDEYDVNVTVRRTVEEAYRPALSAQAAA